MPPDPIVDPAAAPLWHADVAPEIVGKWQSKGFDLSDPKKVALAVTKSYVEAEGFIGAPPNEVLRLPKAPTEPGWDKVWQRLGMPADPKDYDFSSVKFANGDALDAAFTDFMRETAKTNFLPKDTAARVTAEIVKFMEKQDANELVERQATIDTQKAALKENWKANYDAHLFAASQAAKALNVTKAQVDALQDVIGYDKVMEMFRTISTKIGEDKFTSGNPQVNDGVLTKEQAEMKLAELKQDKGWGARLLAGDVAAKRESAALAAIIAGDDTQDSRNRSGK